MQMNRHILTAFSFLYVFNNAFAQTDYFIFSAIKGTASKENSMTHPGNATGVKWIEGDSSFFKLNLANNKKVQIVFQPANDFIGVATAKAQLKNTSGKTIAYLDFTGLSTRGLEGENEPSLSNVVDALGYTINIGWNTLANNSLPQLQGDEIPSAVFRKAGKGKVEMIPVADILLILNFRLDIILMKTKKPINIMLPL